ncbi:hypothetical protein AVEN_208518-1 [Araneus ventricosus]|uniref:Transposase Tc1-like domain-containing protein n=1 Tax=Araneus ventricosus TaxID=182803 RepID=A0A4Y2E6H4_ARAVE|nr:hypothetical protein AVEN_208518-1 [Araneus ventricosus]
MGKCKDVTEWQKGAIVFGRAHGHTVSEVSGFVGVSQRTVQRVYKQWCNTRGHETRRQNCCRKNILTERDRRRVLRLVNQNRFQTRQELLQPVNEGPSQPVSERTLRRELHAMNIWSRVPRKRPLLTQAHKAARL